MRNAPGLVSMGLRTMKLGYSSIWVAPKRPCCISHSAHFIIIVDYESRVIFVGLKDNLDRRDYGNQFGWQIRGNNILINCFHQNIFHDSI